MRKRGCEQMRQAPVLRQKDARIGVSRSSRRDDRNPRYAADENYDEYRADREERSERPRRRVRRDFDPFED